MYPEYAPTIVGSKDDDEEYYDDDDDGGESATDAVVDDPASKFTKEAISLAKAGNLLGALPLFQKAVEHSPISGTFRENCAVTLVSAPPFLCLLFTFRVLSSLKCLSLH